MSLILIKYKFYLKKVNDCKKLIILQFFKNLKNESNSDHLKDSDQ